MAAPKTRRSLFLVATSGADNLQVRETAVPAVLPDQVLVHVKFCGLNFAECMMRQGLYSPMPPLPYVPGYEYSGIIGEVGAEVKDKKVGDRVVGAQNFGCWQDVVVVPADTVFVLPDNMSLEDAAALPVNYLTSYIMLFDQVALREGQSVFVHMAAGGVGAAVGQLCRTVPNVEVFGTASAGKHKHCLANGITYPIDYNTKDYVTEVKAISPRGVDVMLDPMGGKDSARSHSLLKPLGKHIHYGGSSYVNGSEKGFSFIFRAVKGFFSAGFYNGFRLMDTNVMVGGLHVGKLMLDPANHDIVKRAMTRLLQMYAEGKIKPVVDTIWHFEQITQAMDQIYSRKNVGKVLLNAEKMSVESSEKE